MKALPGKMGKREKQEELFLLLKKQRQQKMVMEIRATTIAARTRKGTFLFLLFILVLFIL